MGIFRGTRARVRCYVRTSGAHELEIASARCKYCRRPWEKLYRFKTDPPVPPPSTALTPVKPLPRRSLAAYLGHLFKDRRVHLERRSYAK